MAGLLSLFCTRMPLLPLMLLVLIKTPSTCHAGFAARHILEPAVTSGGHLTSLKYTNVGGSGSYQRVTGMLEGNGLSCPKPNDFCVKSPVTVSGSLAPFDSDLTMVFSGPTKIYNIAVYQPPGNSDLADWASVSRFKAGKPNPRNLVFMNNQGGKVGSKSGTWSPCGGSSQSYASGDFAGNVSTPNQELFTGDVPPGLEVNIMTSTKCTSNAICPGYYRGTAHAGWSGSKLFVIEFSMPNARDIATKPPAIWILNGEVVRAAQYGCNCRGMGGKGGCGELDILENLKDAPHNGISELYSFKGATGSGNADYFPRPLQGKVTYGVIFDTATDQIAIQRWIDWKWPKVVTRVDIDAYLSAKAKVVSVA